ncbi:MAG: DegV family protein [Clostridia bacterium]|nr:DegV family protein [Clostridia bacterium]
MRNFIVTIDSAGDLLESSCAELEIYHIDMTYCLDGESFVDTLQNSDRKNFYDKVRSGQKSKTAAINPTAYLTFWSELYEKFHLPIIHVSLSKALSGTINYAHTAAEMLKEDYPDSKVYLVDSYIASLGEGMLALMAADMRDNGFTPEQCMEKLDFCRRHINTFYTTDTLKYFVEGGRLSKFAGAVGTVLNINPILDCYPDGGLKTCAKARGGQAALKRVCDDIAQTVVNPTEQIIFISHSDAPERAQTMAKMLTEQYGFKDVYTSFIGAAVGTHCGPGCVAVFYFGKERGTMRMPAFSQPPIHLHRTASSML